MEIILKELFVSFAAASYVPSMGLNTYLLTIKFITVAACQFLKVAILHILFFLQLKLAC